MFHLLITDQTEVLLTTVPAKEWKDPDVVQAMNEELEKWIQFDVYDSIPDKGQECIDCHWIVIKKKEYDGLKVPIKARLCIRGFKELNPPRADSPTVDRIHTKMFYSIAANEGWDIQTIDVTSAFLQGNQLQREILVGPPKEAVAENTLRRMKRAAYGLNDASRKWWMKVTKGRSHTVCDGADGISL